MLFQRLLQQSALQSAVYSMAYGAILYTSSPVALSAQGVHADQFREPQPSISASAMADVKVTPDRATIHISVQTRAQTAAVAAANNATKQSSVLSALRKEGINNDQLSTVDYTVEPQYRYVQDKEPFLTGYVVTNTIVADVHDLKQIGNVIDTALASGANMISSLEFYTSNTSDARHQAINEAVTKARADADAAAHAAGGTLGVLLDLNVGGDIAIPPRPMFRAMDSNGPMAAQTPINPGQQTLNISVFTHWLFIPSK